MIQTNRLQNHKIISSSISSIINNQYFQNDDTFHLNDESKNYLSSKYDIMVENELVNTNSFKDQR
jgi:hypothetical protein